MAFSLKEAQVQLKAGKRNTTLNQIAGSTRLAGMVIDSAGKDVILVGEKQPEVKPLELDDLVAGMRSLMKFNEWPLVSLDNTTETKTTRRQKVRLEGGIANTQLGKSLLDADIILKELALGKRSGGVWGVKSYAGLCDDAARRGDNSTASVLFWFFPMNSRLVERDGVFAVGGYEVGTRTQLITPKEADGTSKPVTDNMGEKFAHDMTAAFNDLAVQFPQLRRVSQLYSAVALAHGLQETKDVPDLSYLLNDYAVKKVETPLEMEVLTSDGEQMSLTGGVELRALLLRLQDGDVTALKEAVLRSRPNGSPLTWSLPLSGWQISGSGDAMVVGTSPQGQKNNQFGQLGVSINRQPVLPGLVSKPMWAVPGPAKFQEMPSVSRSASLPRSFASTQVGGVLLSDVATVEGEVGAGAALGKGSFSVLVDGQNALIEETAFKQFVTALWAVYFGREDPGISIDPIASGAPKQLVRYIGNVENSDLGRVMREADYLMKKWAVGTDRPSFEGYKTPDDYSHDLQTLYLGSMSRFWFVPEDMKFKATPDALLFDSGRMTVKTEFLMSNAEGRKADPANERFAEWFTTNYHNQIIKQYPIYKELFDYAKLVALAKHLKESGAPLYWFLLANKDMVLTEESPGTVDALFHKSKHFSGVNIEGGVDIVQKDVKTKGYVFDETARAAIRTAYEQSEKVKSPRSALNSRPKYVADPVSFEVASNKYTAIPLHSSSSGKDRRGLRYQTDISLRTEGFEISTKVLEALQPAIRQRCVWDDLRGKMDDLTKAKSETVFEAAFEKALQSAQAKTGEALRKLSLLKGKFYPTEAEFARDVGFALDDRDQFELLGDILVSYSKYYTSLDLVRVFDPNRFDKVGDFGDGWRVLLPYRLRPASTSPAKGYRLPSKLEVVNLINDRREVLEFESRTNGVIGYFPPDGGLSEFVAILVYQDGSFRLADKLGAEFHFSADGNITDLIYTEDYAIHVEYLTKASGAFESSPYQVTPDDSHDRVEFLNVTLPKFMNVVDSFGKVQRMEFSDQKSPVGWNPLNDGTGTLRRLALLSDASYVLEDSRENEFSFDGAGNFTEVVIAQKEPIIRAMKMGKHRIAFKYRLDPQGHIVIAKAWVSQDEIGAKPLYVVDYEYDPTGKLSNRTLTFANGKSIFGQ